MLAVLLVSAACTRVAVDLSSFDNIACDAEGGCPDGAFCQGDHCVWPIDAEGEGEGPVEGEGEGTTEGEGEGTAEGEGEGTTEGEGEGTAEGEGEGTAEGEGEVGPLGCASVCDRFERACGARPPFCTPACPFVSDVEAVWACLYEAADSGLCDQYDAAAYCRRPGLLGPGGAPASPGCSERCKYIDCAEGVAEGCACELAGLCRVVCQELLGSARHIQCLAGRYDAAGPDCNATLAGFACGVLGHDCGHPFPLGDPRERGRVWGTDFYAAEDNVADVHCPAAPEGATLDEVFSFEVEDTAEAVLEVQAPADVAFSLRPADCTLPLEDVAMACASDAEGCCLAGTGVLIATLQPGPWLVVVESPRVLPSGYSAKIAFR